MKPDEKNLERLIKKVIKGAEAPAADLLFHLTGLGARGSQKLIQTLNKQDGWSIFVRWAETDPILMSQLEAIADAPGVTEKGAEALRSVGIEVKESGTTRTEALRIVEVVQTGPKEKWIELHPALLHNQELLSGVIGLLEVHASSRAVSFLATVLEETLTPQQEQSIRKSIYRMKQKGAVLDESELEASVTSGAEMFLFAENRIPLWQPLFYFRSHSSFTDEGDLFLIQISESDMEIVEQRRSVRISRKALKQMGDRYSEHLRQQSGLAIPFHFVSVPEARYLFERTAGLLKSSSSQLRMEEFLKFLSRGEAHNPFSTFPYERGASCSENFLDHSYFQFWLLDSKDIEDFLTRVKEIREGPIILPEPQVNQMLQVATVDAIEKYFDESRRMIWSFAFEKAAFFLRDTERGTARDALITSRLLADLQASIHEIRAPNALFQRTLDSVKQQKEKEKEEEKRTSVILSPKEFEKMYRKS